MMDGDLAQAAAILDEGYDLERSFGNPVRLSDYYLEYFRLAMATGDEDLLTETFTGWKGHVDSVRTADRNRTLEELEIRFGLKDAQDQIALQEAQIRIQQIWNRGLTVVLVLLLLTALAFVTLFVWNKRNQMTLFRINAQVANPRSMAGFNPENQSAASNGNGREGTLFNQILELFETQRLHRRQGLTLSELASELYSNETYVSHAIRKGSGLNFNGFVNQYRINDAKLQLADRSSGLSIQEIMQDSGFNSRSTFYQVFKEATGLTPRQYRELSR